MNKKLMHRIIALVLAVIQMATVNFMSVYADPASDTGDAPAFNMDADAWLEVYDDFVTRIMNSLSISQEQSEEMITAFGNSEIAAQEAEALGDALARSDEFAAKTHRDEILMLAVEGHAAKAIIGAFIVSRALETGMTGIISLHPSHITNSGELDDEDVEILNFLADRYGVQANVLLDELERQQITAYELMSIIMDKQNELGLPFDDEPLIQSVAASSTGTGVDPMAIRPEEPYSYRAGINESISLNTGELTYTDTLVVLPGRNGLDLNLTMIYNSEESYGEHNNNPQKYLGKGWSFNFTKIINGSNVRFPDGSTYRILANKDVFTLENYKLSDITVKKVNNLYELHYANGRRETFDKDGNISSIQDKYSNKISFVTSTSGGKAETTITDSLGNITKISNPSTAANVKSTYTIELPDASKIQLELSAEGELIKKTDQMGRVTAYSYSKDIAEDKVKPINSSGYVDSGANYFTIKRTHYHLVSVTHPTGLVSKFTYQKFLDTYLERRNVSEYSGSISPEGYRPPLRVVRDEQYHFYRAISMVKTVGTTEYLKETYAISHSKIQPEANYTSTVTSHESTVVYDFNTQSQKLSDTVTYDGGRKVKASYEYDNRKLPTKITTITTEGSSSITTLELYSYDAKGNVLSYTSPLGAGSANGDYTTKMTYDDRFNMMTSKSYKKDAKTEVKEEYVLSSIGRTVSEVKILESNALKSRQVMLYDEYGNVTSLKGYYAANGVTETTFVYDRGAFIKSKTTAGITESYTYDTVGRIRTVKDPNGVATLFTYDKLGRNLTTTFVDGSVKSNTYNDATNSVTLTNENGHKLTYIFDPFGNLSRIENNEGKTFQSFKYDTLLREIERTDGNNVKTTTTYDGANRIASVTTGSYYESYEYSITPTRSYKTVKTVKGGVNAPDIKTFEVRDIEGRVTTAGLSNGVFDYQSTYTHDCLGNVLSELTYNDKQNGNAYTALYEYDVLGNVTKSTVDADVTITSEYDWLGRLVSVTDPKGAKTTNYYDSVGRLTRTDTPFDANVYSTKTYSYDNNGNVTRETVTNGAPGTSGTAVTDYTYDNRNFLTKVTSYDGGAANFTEYDYDKAGNMTAMKTADGTLATRHAYDSMGRLSQLTDPLGLSETYDYDVMGNVTQKNEKNGNVIKTTYNHLNQPLTITAQFPSTGGVPQGGGVVPQTIKYEYAPNGLKLSEENENLKTSFKYDYAGNCVSETSSNGSSKTYAYDFAGNVSELKVLQGTKTIQDVKYSYDKQNRLTKVYDGATLTATYTYDKNGNRASLVYPNGVNTAYTYNAANLVTSLVNKGSTGTLSSYAYSYNLDGNQTKKVENTGKVTTYDYDGLGRLTAEQEQGGGANITRSYAYDKAGNRSTMTVSGDESYATTYQYDNNNRLLKEVKKVGANEEISRYTYDMNGNQLSKLSLVPGDPFGVPSVSFDGGRFEAQRYDAFNRLVEYQDENSKAEYAYKPDGLRLSKTVNGEKTTHVWVGAYIVADVDGQGNLKDSYIRGIGLVKNGKGDYYVFNGHGDVTQLVDGLGNARRDYVYDAFGVEANPDETDTNPWRYCGEYYDKESQTIYLRARYYDPATSRMLSEDPARNGLNWYTYCSNDPVNRIDPTGLYDVMVSYIAGKNDGSATYSESNFLGLGSWNQKVEVTINGVTKTYTIGEKDSVVRIVEGKSVIDHSVLMTDFGLDESQATHLAGDKFDSEKHAVMAFGMMYGQRSKDERQEYGAVIDKDSNGNFSFENVRNSSMSAKDPNNMTDKERNGVNLSYNTNSVASIHTHWRSDGNLNFSNPSDYNEPAQIQTMYLVNRNGEVYQSKRSTKKGNINGFSLGKKVYKIR